ncbi:MAG: heme biosynthesis protein HemY [Burkholderiales bacterium]|nr:heme biosynthesis protein HemY [Burkholderiales bacterium]
MRWVVWLFLLFVVAVLSASTLGANDALVSIFLPPWRVDLSLNLFVLIVIGAALVVQGITRAITSLLDMPERARLWRESRREQAAQQALRDALIFLFAGRYSRSHKAAQRALDIQARSQSLASDAQFAALLHLLAANSLHRLQDKTRRDAQLAEVSTWLAGQTSGGAVGEGAALLAAEWAIDDRQGGRALEQLLALPAGVTRRTLALRLRLQAARLARQPLEALRSARLLANHGGIPALAADGLLRSLAVEALGGARDIDQLRKIWLQLEASERRNPYVCAHAAERAAALDAPGDARAWLRPQWEALARLGEREREAVARALVQALNGLPADWLPLLEAALTALPQDAAVAYAVGRALAQRQLWGRARRLLEGVARMTSAEPDLRRDAWKALAAIAEEEGDTDRAADCYRSATLSA